MKTKVFQEGESEKSVHILVKRVDRPTHTQWNRSWSFYLARCTRMRRGQCCSVFVASREKNHKQSGTFDLVELVKLGLHTQTGEGRKQTQRERERGGAKP